MSEINNLEVAEKGDAAKINIPTTGQIQTQKEQEAVRFENEGPVGFNPLPVVLFLVLFGAAVYKLYKTK